MIRKQSNGKYVLYSKDGSKKLGEGTLEEMKKREQQVNYFKKLKGSMKGKK